MTITILSHHDCAGSAKRLVESVSVLGVDIESIASRKGNTNRKFDIPDSNSVKQLGKDYVASRIERSDIIHIKGDYLYGDDWHGFDISGKKRIQTFTGSRFRRGREPIVSLEKHPIEDYQADVFTAFTPELCYTPKIHLMEFPWNHFEYRWRKGERFKVLHIPSSKKTKGSDIIEDSFRLLDREDVDFMSVTGVGNAEVMRLKSECHLYIDQMILPVYGNAAVEAMSMGIPVMNWGEHLYPYLTPVISPIVKSPKFIALELDKWLDWDRLEKASKNTFEYCKEVHGGVGEKWVKIYRELCG